MAGTFGFDKFHKFLEKKVKEIQEKEKRFLKITAAKAESYVKENVPVDTGNLRRSINIKISDKWSAVGTNIEYAPPHEHGATIKPVNAKYLAIPINKEVKKQTEKYGSPREYINTLKKRGYSIFIKNNTLFASKKKEIIPLYKLKKQTHIKAKHFFKNAKIKVYSELKEIIRGL